MILTSRFPYPLEKGDKLRIFHQLKFLAKHYKIHLVTIDDELKDASVFQDQDIQVHQFVIPIYKRLWSIFLGLFIARPMQVSYFYNSKIASGINSLYKDLNIDRVYCHLARMAPYAMMLNNAYATIDYMDAFSLIANRRSKLGKYWERIAFRWEAKKMKEYEQNIESSFRHKVVISFPESTYFKEHHGITTEVIPNGINLDFFYFKDEEKKYDLVFVGNMSYHPNILAAEYIIDNLLPKLIQKFPNISLLIAGINPPSRLKQKMKKHVTFTGWVEDIREAYWKSKIMIAPIFAGSGQQNKVLESFACGVPVITTDSVGAGIGIKEVAPVLLAQKEAEFIENIVLLLSNQELYNELKREGIQYVSTYFDWNKSNQKLNKIISS